MRNTSSLQLNVMVVVIGAVLTTATIFGVILWNSRQKAVLDAADARTYTAALCLGRLLPAGYHDGITDAHSVPPAEYDAMVAANNQLCRQAGLQYVWSVLVLASNHIVFTSATAPHERQEGMRPAGFFEVHADPRAFAPVLESQVLTFSMFGNQWGRGRMAMVPRHDRNGRVYLLCASVSLSELDHLRRRTILDTLLVAALLGLLASLFLIRTLRSLLAPISRLSEAAQRMIRGDFETPLQARGSREALQLAQSLDLMRHSIREQLDSLRRSETRVRHLNEVLLALQHTHRLVREESQPVDHEPNDDEGKEAG